MKRIRPLILAAAIVVFCSAPVITGAAEQTDAPAAAASATAEKPRAVLPVSKHTFDAVVDGTLITHEFKIKNEGTADLAIHQVKTG